MSFPTGSSTSLATITAMLLVGTMAEEMIRAPSTPNALLPSRSSFSACASTIHSAIRFMATVVYSPLQPFHLHLVRPMKQLEEMSRLVSACVSDNAAVRTMRCDSSSI
eukprot:6819674-Pyramimonas_sp.AAC.1